MNWFQGSIPEAISSSRQRQSIFVVVITADNDENSAQLLENLNDVQVSEIFKNFVSIHLKNGSVEAEHFSKLYPIVVLPSIYMIGLQGVPLEVVGGLVDRDTLTMRASKALQLHSEQSRNTQATAHDSGSANTAFPTESPSTSVPGEESLVSVEDETVNNLEEAAKDSTQTSMEERVEKAQNLLAAIREKKQAEEKENEKKREQERRELGKSLQQFQEAQRERERRELAEQRKKEKREEKEALEKIRQQIAQDRADRNARYQAAKAEEEQRQRAAQLAQQQLQQERAAAAAAARSTSARLQFRLPDGSTRTEQFPSDVKLDHITDFIDRQIQLPFNSYVLCSTFPRREFDKEDMSKSLRDLNLAPSAALLIVPKTSKSSKISSVRATSGPISWITWLLSPLHFIINFISSFIFAAPQPIAPPPGNGQEPSPTRPIAQGDRDHSGVRRRVRQEGNIRRLIDASADESSDDNATWNGNSTQQL